MNDSTFITRVILKNYKSIAACDVKLQPLTFLVGRNGVGKSNFLDALRFVADALNTSLDQAIRVRGGIRDVCKRTDNPRNHHNYMSIHLEFALSNGAEGYYTFRIETRLSRYVVQTEECKFRNENIANSDIYFNVERGDVIDTSAKVAPAASRNRLYLANASGLPEFRPIYDAFSQMGFYNINPDIIRDLQDPDFGNVLLPDGSNLTSVYDQLSPDVIVGIREYLQVITPGIKKVFVRKIEHKETFQFYQYSTEDKRPLTFLAKNMSDGTLRALGILVALFQKTSDGEESVTLVGIEEPEIALHPASVGVLLDAFQDAADKTQVIITSHSPDLLDNKELDLESILAVDTRDGNTVIGPVDDASKSVLSDKLFTTGELLRRDQLQPAQESIISDEI